MQFRPLALAIVPVLWFASCEPTEDSALSFVALGDAPYGKPDKAYPIYRRLISTVNKANPNLVVHLGDTHGHRTCDDAVLDTMRGFMNDFGAPVLYTPGDNEWTDCRDTQQGKFDPLRRLAYIRSSYFQTGQTLGRAPVPVENQGGAGYPENARLKMNNSGFITLHVVGSNNNFDPNHPSAITEFMARNKADLDWLSESFDAFEETDAIVVALHADMFRPQSGFFRDWQRWSPYRDIGVLLGKRSSAWEKPVLLLYGDSHKHKAFQPFPDLRPYLYAIQIYGEPDIKAIEIAVRPESDSPFSVSRVFDP